MVFQEVEERGGREVWEVGEMVFCMDILYFHVQVSFEK